MSLGLYFCDHCKRYFHRDTQEARTQVFVQCPCGYLNYYYSEDHHLAEQDCNQDEAHSLADCVRAAADHPGGS